MRGAKPKPTDQKKAAGTLRKSRTFADELKFDPLSATPAAPEFLGEYGRIEWDRVVPQLQARGILTETDLSVLTAYCLEMQSYYEDRNLIKSGKVEKFLECENQGGGTYYTVHPAVASGNKHLTAALKIATEFGLTPSSRTRISVGKAKDEDPDKQTLLRLIGGGK